MLSCRVLPPILLAAAMTGFIADGRANDAEVEPASFSAGDAARDGGQQTRLYRELLRRRGGDEAALAQLIQLARGLPAEDVAAMYEELARAHLAAGAWDMAAQTRRTFVEQEPQNPAAREAVLWLVRAYGGSETARVRRRIAGAGVGAGVGEGLIVTPGMTAQRGAGGSTDASGSSGATQESGVDRGLLGYAVALADGAARLDAPWKEDSAILFQRAVALRRLGDEKPSRTSFSKLAHRHADDPWARRAQAEAWLDSERDKPAPLPLAKCLRTVAPHLDGVLDEACWKRESAALREGEAPAELPRGDDFPHAGSAGASPSRDCDVRLACDDRFLYVAIHCPGILDHEGRQETGPRTRDADLGAYDRVRLRFDVDRDYATAYELTVDRRGWPGDRCWDDAAWNPRWFIAAKQTTERSAGDGGGSWTIEAAIAWSELTDAAPKRGEAWACAAQRLGPGSSHEPDTSNDSPAAQEFALLLFD